MTQHKEDAHTEEKRDSNERRAAIFMGLHTRGALAWCALQVETMLGYQIYPIHLYGDSILLKEHGKVYRKLFTPLAFAYRELHYMKCTKYILL